MQINKIEERNEGVWNSRRQCLLLITPSCSTDEVYGYKTNRGNSWDISSPSIFKGLILALKNSNQQQVFLRLYKNI